MTTNQLIQQTPAANNPIECIRYSVGQLTEQVHAIQDMMRTLMKKDIHYGVIPGCGDKPTLLKAGAEKLCLMFRLSSTYEINIKDFQNNHREYEIKCTLTHIPSGQIWGEGVGAATTLENKYRYRWENTNKPVPSTYWQNRDSDLLGGSQFTARKVNKQWLIFERIEHDNPPDYYNTILKMAKKRAQVDACLTATAASDIFNQDIEELVENGNEEIISSSINDKQTKVNGDTNFTDYIHKMDLAQNKKELMEVYEEAFEKAKQQQNGEMMTELARQKNKKLTYLNLEG